MNITFESANIGQKDAHALIAFLTALYPLPATPSIPSSLPPAPSAPPVEMQEQNPIPPTPPTPIDQPATRKRRTKAEIAADEAAAKKMVAVPGSLNVSEAGDVEVAAQDPTQPSAAAPAEVSATTQPAPAPQTTVGADELRALLNGYIAKHSMEDAIGKLREFNCNRVTEALSLPADQLSLLAAALRG